MRLLNDEVDVANFDEVDVPGQISRDWIDSSPELNPKSAALEQKTGLTQQTHAGDSERQSTISPLNRFHAPFCSSGIAFLPLLKNLSKFIPSGSSVLVSENKLQYNTIRIP